MVATWTTVATIAYAASLGGVYAAPAPNYARAIDLGASLGGPLSALQGAGYVKPPFFMSFIAHTTIPSSRFTVSESVFQQYYFLLLNYNH